MELETTVFNYLTTVAIFFVAGLALFNFTRFGKSFSIISLIVALILLISLVVHYFVEKSRRDTPPRPLIEILMYSMIVIIFLVIWILFEVWKTPASDPISDILNIERKNLLLDLIKTRT